MRRTKIVCTIGPASQSPAMKEKLIKAGINVARLNFSHGTQKEHEKTIRAIRDIAKSLKKPVAILQDLAGPKIRIGKFVEGSITLESGNSFTLTNRNVPGDQNRVKVSYSDLPKIVSSGERILLSDGSLELVVKEKSENDIKCEVVIGGILSSNKGINLPTSSIKGSCFTKKDESDLEFGISQNVDYVALSFVRTSKDIVAVKKFMEKKRHKIPIIAKIEKHEALTNIDEIMDLVDGIMVARGDLGVEIPINQVPRIQKMLIERANLSGRIVITATQMLRSMVDNSRPTRAEVADIANAILDGSDAIMLSEESAIGKYPLESVEMMTSIAEDVELSFPYDSFLKRFGGDQIKSHEEAVGLAACNLANSLKASAIVAYTQTGRTALLISKYRPEGVVLALTHDEKTYRRLALKWGVFPMQCEEMENTDEMMERAISYALNSGLARRGQSVVITAGSPVGITGRTNIIKADRVG